MKILMLVLTSLFLVSCASHHSTTSRTPASLNEIDSGIMAEDYNPAHSK